VCPESSPRFKRALQLHLVSHVAHALSALDGSVQAWWSGSSSNTSSAAVAGREDPLAAAVLAEDEEEEEEVMLEEGVVGTVGTVSGDRVGGVSGNAEELAPSSSSPALSARRGSFNPPSPSATGRRRSSLAPSPAQRAEQLRQRAQLRERLTSSLIEDEVKQQAEKQEARRASRCYSYSRSSTRGGAGGGAGGDSAGPPLPGSVSGGSRRSTLLLDARERKESSTLPASSFRSLPHAQPTELVFKTVKRLRSLVEDSEGEEEKEGGEGKDEDGGTGSDSSGANAVGEGGTTSTEDAAVIAAAETAIRLSTPPLHGPSLPLPDQGSSSSVSASPEPAVPGNDDAVVDNDGGSDSEEDDTSDSEGEEDVDRAHSAVPLAEEDDADPEIALTLPSPLASLAVEDEEDDGSDEADSPTPAAAAPAPTLGSPRHLHRRTRSSLSSLHSDFVALHAVQEAEELEEEGVSPVLGELDGDNEGGDEAVEAGHARSAAVSHASASVYDAAEFTDSSDDEYEEVAPSFSTAGMRASVVARMPKSAEALQLEQMEAAEAAQRRALREAERLAAAEEARLARELAEMEADHGERVDHGVQANDVVDEETARVRRALLRPMQLNAAVSASAGPLRLAQLATAVMQAVRPTRLRSCGSAGAGFVSVAASSRATAQGSATAGAAAASGGRHRSGTSFALSAKHTPSFIRQLQLAKALYSFDADLGLVLTSLRYAYSCSKHNLHAVLLFGPKVLYSLRLSNYTVKQLLFHHLEICKPRYSRVWMHGLWHLAEAYKSMALLQKARDCLEELRLIAVRQKIEGLPSLFASQVGLAAVHQSQLCGGRVSKWGSWIDHVSTVPGGGGDPSLPGHGAALSDAAAAAEREALPEANLVGSYATNHSYSQKSVMGYSVASDGGALSEHSTNSNSSAITGAHRAHQQHAGASGGVATSPSPVDSVHITAVLDAIIECYERALSTLEGSSMMLLSSAAEVHPLRADVRLGMHAFARPSMMVLLRLGVFYCYKHAFQNALNVLRRAVEIKAAEIEFRKQVRAQRARKESSKSIASGAAPMSPTSRAPPRMLRRAGGGGAGGGGSSHVSSLLSLLPFAIPSSTRLLCGALFTLGLVHLRTGDLEEALGFFERSRRIAARIVARRYRKEKSDRNAAWTDPLVAATSDEAAQPGDGASSIDATSPSIDAAAESSDTAWTLSASFLSSLATPAHAADVMAYVRAVYMLSITHDRLAAHVLRTEAREAAEAEAEERDNESIETPPLASLQSAAAPSARSAAAAALHSYRALVLRRSVIALWHRVATGHKVISPHEDMWRVAVGMSVLEPI